MLRSTSWPRPVSTGKAGVGDRHGDRLGVEHGQLVARPATADDDDGIERTPGQQLDAAGDHRHGTIALDTDVAHRETEADAAAAQLVLEVVPGGAADARDDADAQRHRAQRVALVAVEMPAGDEPAEYLVALLGEVAEREAWIDPAHLQGQSAGRGVEVEVAVDAHLHPVTEDEAVPLEETAQPLALRGEEGDLHDRLRVGLVVGEREVGVRPSRAPALDLATHPHAVVETGAQTGVDDVGELADGERALGLEVGGCVRRTTRSRALAAT